MPNEICLVSSCVCCYKLCWPVSALWWLYGGKQALMRGVGSASCSSLASGTGGCPPGPGGVREGEPGAAGWCLSMEKGAAGRTWVSGRRMLSWLTSRAGALIRLLIWGKYIQQGGQACDVQTLLGVQSGAQGWACTDWLTSGGKPVCASARICNGKTWLLLQ